MWGKKKLNKHHCHPPRGWLFLSRLNSSPSYISKLKNLESNFRSYECYTGCQRLQWSVISQPSSCNAAFSLQRKRRWRMRGGWWRERETERQRRRDHMEFHSFRFLSQMLFLKLTHVVFITPDSSKQLVCGAESLALCLLWAWACTSVRASSHMWCRAFHTCARISVWVCVCVCVCVCQIWMHSITLFTGRAAWEVCVRCRCYTLSSHVQLK